jgi:hypothetical protein
MLTSLWTIGEIIIMAGKAMRKAKLQAFSHISIMLLTMPTLKTLMTNDMIHDISNAIKKENTIL